MQIIADRRALHATPELDKQLPNTLALVRGRLSGLGCEISAPTEGALCAYFDFGKPETVAFRADMDALPIQEATGLPFASQNPGIMHACGHDGHTAILLELARRVSGKKDLPHNILLVFQPAEETTGGAKDICQSGIFEKYHTAAIFGLHLWPGLPKGILHACIGPQMARSCEVSVTVEGRSVHIAKPEGGLDALAAAVSLYQKARELEQTVPGSRRILNFGRVEAGTVRNAIAANARMLGSLRAMEESTFEALRDGLLAAGREIEATTGCALDIRISEGYPPVTNPADLCQRVARAVPYRVLEESSMTAEDFSFYQKKLPGMFFFLGLGDTPPLHAANFDFDESILVKGAEFFEALAENFQ